MDLRAQYDEELRRRLRPPPGRRRVDEGGLVRIVGPTAHALDNMVCHSRLDAASADAAIDALVARSRVEGRAVHWNVHAHDEPGDLGERLVRRGFASLGEERVMALPSDAGGLSTACPPGVTLRRVRHARELDAVVEVQEAVWGDAYTEWLLAWWRPALAGEGDPLALFVADAGGRPAGAAWTVLAPGAHFAPLFGGTVLPDFRRRGIHRALVGARAEAACAAAIPWLLVEANAQSEPLMARLAFRPIATRRDYVLAAAPRR